MINTKHKDRLFCFLFGREENKKWTLSLYNAVNGSSHTDPDMIRITTMEDVLYMGMKNDAGIEGRVPGGKECRYCERFSERKKCGKETGYNREGKDCSGYRRKGKDAQY